MSTVKSDIKAFRMYGNIYFVGSTEVSVHAIDTEEGIILIDTGYPSMFEQILDSISSVGLDVKRVRAIFHSHGHYDHYGCTARLRGLTGAKTYISKIDNEIVNGTLDLSWATELGFERIPPFECDVLIEPSEVFTFGRTKIRCEAAPGHTDGTLAFFITVPSEDGDGEITAAMHGGIGLGSMRREFLLSRGLTFECRDRFLEGIERLLTEKCDLVLGNHPEQNGTVKKLARREAGESLIDTDEWQKFLESARRGVLNLIEKEKQNA